MPQIVYALPLDIVLCFGFRTVLDSTGFLGIPRTISLHGHSGVKPTALAVGGKPANPLCQEKT